MRHIDLNIKKEIILLSFVLVVILLSVSYLLNSYATNVLSNHNGENEYTITLSEEDNSINIPSHSSKIVFYKIKNTNKGTVQYGVGYNYVNTDDNSLEVYIKGYEDNITGLIEKDETKFIKLKIYNQTDNDENLVLSTILGYETGGDLIVPEGISLVDSVISSDNATITYNSNDVVNGDSLFLNTGLLRKNIANLTIANDNIIPAGFNNYISLKEDNSMLAWWKENNENPDLVDLYIGAEYGKVVAPVDSSKLFAYLPNVKTINLSNLDTSKVTTMISMFYGCSSLTTLDISGFNTSNVTSMSYMFWNCSGLTTLNLSSFDTSNVTDMGNMFYSCSSLTTLDISNFNTSKVTTMRQMFSVCSSLTTLNLSSFDTSNVTDMNQMFYNCSSLTTLNLSSFITTKVNDIEAIFSSCRSLTSLDIRNAELSKVNTNTNAFSSIPNTAKIYVKDSTEKAFIESKITGSISDNIIIP